LEQVNGQPFQKRKLDEKEFTREEENENRFRNRGFNLTYRQELTESETLISGRAFSPASQGSIPEVSLEQRFAKRLDLGIGDKLTFDIQGIPIEALVVSLRKVRWTSFQPNFFIQFAEGILQDAPKTHLLTLPAMSMEKKMDLQNQVIDAFPNVSIIDVTKLVERLSELLNQMSVTLQILALVTLIVGAFILFTVATFMAEERKADVAIMKAIGVKFRRIQSLFIFEFSIPVFLASLFGILISIV